MTLRHAPMLAALMPLAACSGGGEPAAPEQTRPAPAAPAPTRPAPAAPPAGDWQDAALTPGMWLLRRDDRGTLALFGVAQEGARLTLRCDRARRALYLSRASTARGPVAMTIRTYTSTETVTAQPTGGTPPYVAAEFAPAAPILAAMAYTRGRFAVETPEGRLVVPVRPEITRVIGDCA